MNRDEIRHQITELEAQTPRTLEDFNRREEQIRTLLEVLTGDSS